MKISAILISTLLALNAIAAEPPKIRFSVVRTSLAPTKEGLVIQGGALGKDTTLNHSAFLIEHGDEVLLLDSGLGRNVEKQMKADQPFWAKPFFKYEDLKPAADQIEPGVKARIKRVFLSHLHWDHASGIEDFLPGPCISVPEEEMRELKEPKAGATCPSQFAHEGVKWCNFTWSEKAYRGFEKSYDVFGDGTAVAVPLPGHSFGSIGVFLKLKDKDLFLVGDLVWTTQGITQEKHKFYVASKMVDRDRELVMESIKKVHAEIQKDPKLVVIPAHDAEAQAPFGYYPKWVKW